MVHTPSRKARINHALDPVSNRRVIGRQRHPPSASARILARLSRAEPSLSTVNLVPTSFSAAVVPFLLVHASDRQQMCSLAWLQKNFSPLHPERVRGTCRFALSPHWRRWCQR